MITDPIPHTHTSAIKLTNAYLHNSSHSRIQCVFVYNFTSFIIACFNLSTQTKDTASCAFMTTHRCTYVRSTQNMDIHMYVRITQYTHITLVQPAETFLPSAPGACVHTWVTAGWTNITYECAYGSYVCMCTVHTYVCINYSAHINTCVHTWVTAGWTNIIYECAYGSYVCMCTVHTYVCINYSAHINTYIARK